MYKYGNVILDHPIPGERIEVVIKRHWVAYVGLFLFFLGGVFVSFIFAFFFFGELWFRLVLIIFWMSYLIFLFTKWLDNELDMFIVTNERVVGIEQVSFLNRIVSECGLGQVEEVGSKTKGLFANIFNYGTIEIQTAGSSSNFMMDAVPDPIGTSRQIHNIINVYRGIDEEDNSNSKHSREEKEDMVDQIRKNLNPSADKKLKEILKVGNNNINKSVDDILDK